MTVRELEEYKENVEVAILKLNNEITLVDS